MVARVEMVRAVARAVVKEVVARVVAVREAATVEFGCAGVVGRLIVGIGRARESLSDT